MSRYTIADAEDLKRFLAPAGQANLSKLPASNGMSDFQMIHVKGSGKTPDSIYMHVAGRIFTLSGSSAPWPRSTGGGGIPTASSVASIVAQYKRQVPLVGTMNGSNTLFLIPVPIYATTETIMFNGQVMEPGVWYTISGQSVTVIGTPIPDTGDAVTATYFAQ